MGGEAPRPRQSPRKAGEGRPPSSGRPCPEPRDVRPGLGPGGSLGPKPAFLWVPREASRPGGGSGGGAKGTANPRAPRPQPAGLGRAEPFCAWKSWETLADGPCPGALAGGRDLGTPALCLPGPSREWTQSPRVRVRPRARGARPQQRAPPAESSSGLWLAVCFGGAHVPLPLSPTLEGTAGRAGRARPALLCVCPGTFVVWPLPGPLDTERNHPGPHQLLLASAPSPRTCNFPFTFPGLLNRTQNAALAQLFLEA